MSGYLISVHRQIIGGISHDAWQSLKGGAKVLKWRGGLEDIRRLDSLVSEGKAIDFGSNGYPSRYAITAKELRAHLLIGSSMDHAAVDECAPNEWLFIDAWDES